MKEQGRHIPQDVALAGFSNAEFATLTEPPLTTVDQCSRHMGSLAVRQLLHLLHPAPGGQPLNPVLLTPKLLIRSSFNPQLVAPADTELTTRRISSYPLVRQQPLPLADG